MKFERYPMIIADCVVCNEIIYFFAKNFNALYKYDYKEEKRTFLGKIPDEKTYQKELVGNLLLWKDNLILVPRKTSSNKIWIYNVVHDKWSYLNIEFNEISPFYDKISYATLYKDMLIGVGCYYNGIIRIHLKTGEIEYYKGILDKDASLHALYSCEKDKDYLLVPSPNTNHVTRINMENLEYQVIKVGNENCMYSGICKANDYFWLAPRKDSNYIVKWDGYHMVQEYHVPKKMMQNKKYIFCGASCIGNSIYMFGGNNRESMVFDPNNYNDWRIAEKKYSAYKRDDDYILLQDIEGNVVLLSRGDKYEISLTYTVDEICSEIPENTLQGELVYEDIGLPLAFLLDMLSKKG